VCLIWTDLEFFTVKALGDAEEKNVYADQKAHWERHPEAPTDSLLFDIGPGSITDTRSPRKPIGGGHMTRLLSERTLQTTVSPWSQSSFLGGWWEVSPTITLRPE